MPYGEYMKRLKIIQFKVLTPTVIASFEKRQAARAVVFDTAGNISLLRVSKHHYHKLPGGGALKPAKI